MVSIFAEVEDAGVTPDMVADRRDSGRRLTVCDHADGVVLRVSDSDGVAQHIRLSAGQCKALRKDLKRSC